MNNNMHVRVELRKIAIMVMGLAFVACSIENSLSGALDNNEGNPTQRSAAIEVDPQLIDFGFVHLGMSHSQEITVRNAGDDVLVVEDLIIPDVDGAVSVTQIDQATLQPGEFSSFVVTYEPTSMTALSETLYVASNVGDEPVELLANVHSPKISVQPISHDFGELAVGEMHSVDIRVSNDGVGDLDISGATWTSSSPTELILGNAEAIQAGMVLASGEETTVTVYYGPENVGFDESVLRIFSNDPTQPEVAASQQGQGVEHEYVVDTTITADDVWSLWIDGVEYTGTNFDYWLRSDTIQLPMASGEHVIAVHVRDTGEIIAGLSAMVSVDGGETFLSGEGGWVQVSSAPSSGWQDVGFNDSTWKPAQMCDDPSTWTKYPGSLYKAGASWIWHSSDCNSLGQTWFRFKFTLP